MRRYNVNIAGYKIRFENNSYETEILPSQRFSRFISADKKYDFLIRIQSGKILIPENAVKVFDAPFVEEINNIRIKKSEDFWSVYQYHDDLFIKVKFPNQDEERSAVLKFSLHGREWELGILNPGKTFDPMEYPLDGLILYYITVFSRDIMIHGSGVNFNGRGYLFSGISGRGKTTIAGLWNDKGAKIIHDDRLILRKTLSGYSMYNTPVYNNEAPGESHIDRIFLIEHGTDNEMVPVKSAAAISLVMANCIQHNWDRKIIEGLLDSVLQICSDVPVYKLRFRPDSSIVEFLLKNEQNEG